MMTVDQLALAFKCVMPTFRFVEGYYLLVMPGNSPPPAECLRRIGDTSREDFKRTERDINRCFIIANVLDEIGIDVRSDSGDGSLLTVAQVLEALIRDGLARRFPGQEFEVETRGAAGVEHEPLELCVTFSRR